MQGEGRTIGYPTVFVRLTGCPLRCRYCDTRYAFQGGGRMSLDEILAAVRARQPVWRQSARRESLSEGSHPSSAPCFVTVTGGEPLAQPACRALLSALCDAGCRVSLETSGALDVAGVDGRVSIVMDIKTPGSGEAQSNRRENLAALSSGDQVKFVICHREDYEWARARLHEWDIPARCEVLFLPVHGGGEPAMPPRTLADWILADGLPVRMQIPLHKYLWGDAPGR